jgi:hypothetical protein
VQRDLIGHGGTTATDADEFTIDVDFVAQEEEVHAADNDFLRSLATLDRTADHRILCKRVPPGYRVTGSDGDFETCLKIQAEPGLEHADETP